MPKRESNIPPSLVACFLANGCSFFFSTIATLLEGYTNGALCLPSFSAFIKEGPKLRGDGGRSNRPMG